MNINETFIKLLYSKEFDYLGPYPNNKMWEYFQIYKIPTCQFWYQPGVKDDKIIRFDSIAIKPECLSQSSTFDIVENKLQPRFIKHLKYKDAVLESIACLKIFEKEINIDCSQVLSELNKLLDSESLM